MFLSYLQNRSSRVEEKLKKKYWLTKLEEEKNFLGRNVILVIRPERYEGKKSTQT